VRNGFESQKRGTRRRKLVDLKFVGALPYEEPLQHYGFPVRYPGRVHDETALEVVSTIGVMQVVSTHFLRPTILEIKIEFVGSGPRRSPTWTIARPKHVTSLLQGLLSLGPPFFVLALGHLVAILGEGCLGI